MISKDDPAKQSQQRELFQEQCEMIARITILWLKKGCRYETWLAYKNFFLMNILSITPI